MSKPVFLLFYGTHQKIEKVAELPDCTYYQADKGKMYTVFHTFYLPLCTTEELRLVGFVNDTYFDLDEEIMEIIKIDTKIKDTDKLNKMPF